MSLGPRKNIPQRGATLQDQKNSLASIQKDIKTLENQRQLISRVVLEMLTGYESILRRVRASGDRSLAKGTALHLRELAAFYQYLQRQGLLSEAESSLIDDYTRGLVEASRNIELGCQKVSHILDRTGKQQKSLLHIRSRLSSMKPLQVDEESFFDSPDKRESLRRTREIDRRRRP